MGVGPWGILADPTVLVFLSLGGEGFLNLQILATRELSRLVH